jgi:LacI family transcriptional regulator, galactose operon repressor
MATIKDVAREAGVSVSTVSRVISSNPNVSDGTRKRVRAVIERIGYQPSAIAQGLVSQRTRTIGVVVSDISSPFYPQVVRGIEDVANARGFTIVLFSTDDDLERHATALKVLHSQRVRGIVHGSARLDDAKLPEFIASGIPTVLVNRGLPNSGTSQVLLKNRRGAELATQHLIDLGHRRLLHLAGPRFAQNARDRAAGFRRAARRNGLSADEARVLPIGFHQGIERDAVLATLHELLSRDDRPSAILAVDDVIGVWTMEVAIGDLALSVPDDLAVVGFDDSYLASSRFVSLTTVAHRPYEMGSEAARLLLDRLEGDGGWPVRIDLEPELVVRGSTVRYAGRGRVASA